MFHPLGAHSDWDEPDFDPESWEEPELPQRDSAIDDAKAVLEGFFARENLRVFYQRQLQIIFEGEFFHWITARALSELVGEGKIASDTLPLPPTGRITLYRATTHRYWRRQADEIIALVTRFSAQSFTQALGAHGELMFDAALPSVGFIPTARKVRSYGSKEWVETGHDLDRVFERDGVGYGTEIKNTLSYIESDELVAKVRMSKHLGLRPLFIVRMAPKSYINEVQEEGGFTLVFKYQLYPFGQKHFADTVREGLQIPADCPVRIADGTVQRFLNWHLKKLPKASKL
ncbi:MAG TPA: hypothetical protein VHF01_13190 [Candidatus Acidoferrum sp.]|nr:hypothetical protein [Candidatus Acidoferrum sp.]